MKILVVEDDAEIVEFVNITFGIGWSGAELVSTDQGSNVAELVENQSPDMVILDLNLPDISGFEVLKRIRTFSTVPVIIVTVSDSEADIVKGLEWGADEYVVKPFGQLELLARVRAVMRGRHYPSREQIPILHGPFRFDPDTHELSVGVNRVPLTRTESHIVHLLMSNIGEVVTYSQLAEEVWGGTYPNSKDTLRVYIRRLRSKVGAPLQYKFQISSRPGVGYFLELLS